MTDALLTAFCYSSVFNWLLTAFLCARIQGAKTNLLALSEIWMIYVNIQAVQLHLCEMMHDGRGRVCCYLPPSRVTKVTSSANKHKTEKPKSAV
jgi:hypothetical protein